MRASTILHPALLGHRDAFAREVARLQTHSRAAGLFDLPVDELGLHGQTVPEHEVLRALQMLGEAFGLPAAALLEWHRLFAFEEMPSLSGALVAGCAGVLPDLMLRARTFTRYQDRERRGSTYMRVWARAKPLQTLLECKARLLKDLERPIRTQEAGALTRIEVLGAIDITIDRSAQQVAICTRVAIAPGGGRHKTLRWVPVIWPAKWLRYWMLIRDGLPLAASTPLHQVLRWLMRDPEVKRLTARLSDELLAHPAWPRAAMDLAGRAYGQAGLPRLHAKTVTWAWRHPRLYGELLAHAPCLVHLMPSVHNQSKGAIPLEGLRDLRAWLVKSGLSAAGWRWLAANAPPLTRAATHLEWASVNYVVLMANFLGSVGVGFVPSDPFLPYLFDLLFEYDHAIDQCPWLAQLAWRHCETLGDDAAAVEGFVHRSFTPVSLWVLENGWAPDANQRRAGWAAIARAWGRATGRAASGLVRWPVPFESVECGELFAFSIADNRELESEGMAMGHCVADFQDAAAGGTFLPFSVRGPGGQRLATFSFARAARDDEWRFQQCVGPLNRKFKHPAVQQLIHEALALTKAWRHPHESAG